MGNVEAIVADPLIMIEENIEIDVSRAFVYKLDSTHPVFDGL